MSAAERLVLAIDTCGLAGSVAVASVDLATEMVTCVAQAELGSRAAAAQLVPSIATLLQNARLSLRDLHALVVVHGPGSFTGVRVGLSTAKGFCHATGLPGYAISRLAVLAGLAAESSALALLDAGRGEFYARRDEREWLATLDDVSAAVSDGISLVLAETAAAEQIQSRVPRARLRVFGPLDAMAAVRASLPRLRAGTPDDLAALDANYLRRSDAELFARPATQPSHP